MVEIKKNRKKLAKILLATSLLVVLLDQLSKFLITRYLEIGESIPFVGNAIYITRSQNSGIAFSMLDGKTWIPIWVSVIAIGLVLYYYDEIEDKATALFVGLVAGGIVGNLIDRLVFGFVIDFIDFRFWPVFNVADTALTLGVLGIIAVAIRKSQLEKTESDKFRKELIEPRIQSIKTSVKKVKKRK